MDILTLTLDDRTFELPTGYSEILLRLKEKIENPKQGRPGDRPE